MGNEEVETETVERRRMSWVSGGQGWREALR